MFWKSLLRLAFVIVFFTTCAIFSTNSGIFFAPTIACSRRVANMMVIVITVCRVIVMCVLLFS